MESTPSARSKHSTNEIQKFETEITNQLQDFKDELADQINDLKSDVNIENQALKDENEKLRETVSQLQETIIKLEAQLNAQNPQIQDNFRKIQKDNLIQTEEINNLKTQLAEQSERLKEFKELRQENDSLKLKIIEQAKLIANLERKNKAKDEFQTHKKSQESKMAKMQQEIDQAKSEKDALRESLEESNQYFQQEIATLKGTMSQNELCEMKARMLIRQFGYVFKTDALSIVLAETKAADMPYDLTELNHCSKSEKEETKYLEFKSKFQQLTYTVLTTELIDKALAWKGKDQDCEPFEVVEKAVDQLYKDEPNHDTVLQEFQNMRCFLEANGITKLHATT